MHPPSNSVRLDFPVHLKPWYVAGFRATRDEMRQSFGNPHYVESDATRTFGGEEDSWAWELPNGQRVLLVLRVQYAQAYVLCDPPNTQPAVTALGVGDQDNIEIFETPFVDPSYNGP